MPFASWGAAEAVPQVLPDPPQEPPDVRIAEFERIGVVRVPARDGFGLYTIVSTPSAYGPSVMPITVFWNGPEYGSTVHPEWDPSVEYGNRLVFYQSWTRGDGAGFEDQRAAVAMILHFIDTGLPIYRIQCGSYVGTLVSADGSGGRVYREGLM